MARKLKCILLCEDIEQERLFRPLLQRKFPSRRVEVERNGGIAFVLQRVEKLNRELGQHPTEARGALIVVDGDDEGLEVRRREIHGKAGGQLDARIAICVPSRTVETWELWLCGKQDVDETTDYKTIFQRAVEGKLMSARQAFQAWDESVSPTQKELEKGRLPALVAGRAEIARLGTFAK